MRQVRAPYWGGCRRPSIRNATFVSLVLGLLSVTGAGCQRLTWLDLRINERYGVAVQNTGRFIAHDFSPKNARVLCLSDHGDTVWAVTVSAPISALRVLNGKVLVVIYDTQADSVQVTVLSLSPKDGSTIDSISFGMREPSLVIVDERQFLGGIGDSLLALYGPHGLDTTIVIGGKYSWVSNCAGKRDDTLYGVIGVESRGLASVVLVKNALRISGTACLTDASDDSYYIRGKTLYVLHPYGRKHTLIREMDLVRGCGTLRTIADLPFSLLVQGVVDKTIVVRNMDDGRIGLVRM